MLKHFMVQMVYLLFEFALFRPGQRSSCSVFTQQAHWLIDETNKYQVSDPLADQFIVQVADLLT